MDRRTALKTIGAGAVTAAAALAAPSQVLAQDARTLKFIPWGNLANFDPVWATTYVVRDAAAMVWDMLYGIDENLVPQRQMVESEEVSSDGLTWTFKLRPGMKFHDGEPVLAKDAVASVSRWAVRDFMGGMILAIQNELVAVDDLTFRWSLKRPFAKMLYALGKCATPCCFVMPERIARTDANTLIKEYVGSGPMRFVQDEWVSGSKAVFQKFDGYVSRDEPSSWLAGGKRMQLDRVEWVVISDPATAAGAIQNGEVDWWMNPLWDLLPVLSNAPGTKVGVADPLGNIGSLRMNHLHAPFHDPLIRRALMTAMNQADYMRAIVGSDEHWKPLLSFFTPGTPLYNTEGGEILAKADLAEAKRLLEQSSYKGEPVTCIISQDQQTQKAQGDVTADLLAKLGMNVDYVAADWGTVAARRTSKAPPSEGGWSIFHTAHGGADCASVYNALRGNGEDAWLGWPTSPDVETAIATWFDATTSEASLDAAKQINKAAMHDGVFAPTGFFVGYQAWRDSLAGVKSTPLSVFWDVSKAA